MEIIPTIEKEVSNIQHLEIKSHTKLVKEEVRIAKPKMGTKPLIVQVEIMEIIVEEIDVQKVVEYIHFIFCHFPRISRMESKVQKG